MSKKIGTGGIIAIVLGGVAVVGTALYFILRKKAPTPPAKLGSGTVTKNTKPPLNNAPNKNDSSTTNSALDKILKAITGGGSNDRKGGGSSPISGSGGGKVSQNNNGGWIQGSDGYWKDPTDGKYYWDNGDGTLTEKVTGEIYNSENGEFVGYDYGDGSWSDTDGKLYAWNETTGKWEDAGWVYDDGTWADTNGYFYDENDNLLGADNGNGTWTDTDGNVWSNDAGENDQPIGYSSQSFYDSNGYDQYGYDQYGYDANGFDEAGNYVGD
jgi:hypothetical protein